MQEQRWWVGDFQFSDSSSGSSGRYISVTITYHTRAKGAAATKIGHGILAPMWRGTLHWREPPLATGENQHLVLWKL